MTESPEVNERNFLTVSVGEVKCVTCGGNNCAFITKSVIKKNKGRIQLASVVCIECHEHLDVLALGIKTSKPVWFEIL